MIDKALEFICDQVNAYLKLKYAATEDMILLDNIAWHDVADADDNDKSSAFLSLINIEEDRISRSQESFVRNNGNVIYKNPKVFLNLYLLFSVNLKHYDDSLQRLSYIIQFFQYRNVFNPLTTPGNPAHPFPGGVDQLIFDLYTLSFQDLNNLWGIMGSKYLPSVTYKMRLAIIDENFIEGTGSLITKIAIDDKRIN